MIPINLKQKLILKSLIFTLATSSWLLASSVKAFTDIDPADTYAPMFNHLKEVGIMTPFEDGSFRGYQTVSRAEAVTIALRAIHLPLQHPEYHGESHFADVDPNAWYASILDQAVRHRVVFKNAETFRPSEPVTKAGFLAFLFRATRVDFDSYVSRVRNIAEDIDPEEWYSAVFAHAKKYQVAHLPADNKYLPYKYLTRREVGIMTYRQLKLFYGDQFTRNMVELQGQIQRFISLIRAGKNEEAEFHLHRIIALNDKLIRKRNSQDMIATRSLSRSMDHLTDSLRYMQYGRELPAIENLMLALRQARKAGSQSDTLKPISEELAGLVREMLLQVTNRKFVASG